MDESQFSSRHRPSMFVKAHSQISDAMIGSHTVMHLNGTGKKTAIKMFTLLHLKCGQESL